MTPCTARHWLGRDTALKNRLRQLTSGVGTASIPVRHSLDVVGRYITNALLLMEDSVFRKWNAEEIKTLREDATRSLEQDIVNAFEMA